MVGSVVIPASIVPFLIAAMKVSPAPTATYLAWSAETPALPSNAIVSVWVPDPMSVTPRFFPFRSAADVMELAFLLATISASPGAMPNWQIVSIFLPSALSSTGWLYEPEPASTLPATTSSSVPCPEPSSTSVTLIFSASK